jgi:2-polyprenyl-3-methyl-5-hydroxy-6-metoxy-1,4-benzoquinol methylase
MLIEAFIDYAPFLKMHVANYPALLIQLNNKYPALLDYCINKNKQTKKSFHFEWSFLNAKKQDRIWNDDSQKLSTVFMNEVGEEASFFISKSVIDVGCGHGIMTSNIAKLSQIAIGAELSKAVETAYKININSNAWYVQADLQLLPFDQHSFDVVYSSGVIHHTNNTELSLSLIDPLLKEGGKICLWLYHPQNNILHNMMLAIRRVTKHLPLMLCFVLLLIFVFPFSYVIKRIKRKSPPNYREEIIDLLDMFTPRYREEIPHDLAVFWLQYRNYFQIDITTSNQFGFSIAATKKPIQTN